MKNKKVVATWGSVDSETIQWNGEYFERLKEIMRKNKVFSIYIDDSLYDLLIASYGATACQTEEGLPFFYYRGFKFIHLPWEDIEKYKMLE